MSLTSTIQKLFGLERKSGTASPDAWLLDTFSGQATSSGVTVTPRTAMQCAPVHCAVQSTSEAIGQLPVHAYKRGADDAKDRDRDRNHPAYVLLHDAANEWTPAAKFREEITRDALLHKHGGFVFINRVDGGKPFELIRIDPEETPVSVTFEGGEPVYLCPLPARKLPLARGITPTIV
ncbi:phage portal protein [Bradyrhizobium sp. sGM-13]|uniref:phage portal protein n=1 Tax=Bradyrhizobium sp. sGM-13 TaxID=2831781 RepID=UPI001BCD93E7|nr:phage portal protein [Bradyrhizobium sp. sGM-13]